MEFTLRDAQGVAIIEITAGLADEHGPRLEQLLDRLLTEGRRHFVVDLKRVDAMDSPGLAALVRGFTSVRRRAGTLCLVHLQPSVQSILALMRLDRVFESHADVAEAVQAASGQEGRRPRRSDRDQPQGRWGVPQETHAAEGQRVV
jgi:anti-sigma B factor antagonist